MVEIGAGTGIPTVRFKSESLFTISKQVNLVRINPGEQDLMINDKEIKIISDTDKTAVHPNDKNVI